MSESSVRRYRYKNTDNGKGVTFNNSNNNWYCKSIYLYYIDSVSWAIFKNGHAAILHNYYSEPANYCLNIFEFRILTSNIIIYCLGGRISDRNIMDRSVFDNIAQTVPPIYIYVLYINRNCPWKHDDYNIYIIYDYFDKCV